MSTERQYDNPLGDWRKANRPDKATDIRINQWLRAVDSASDSVGGTEALEAWLANPMGSEPDVVQCIADYGYARILIRGWKKLPIEIPEAEHERWKARSYEPTLEGVQEYLAGAAGGFLEAAGHNPGEVIRLIRTQVAEKAGRMEEWANKPLDYYTPKDFSDLTLIDDEDIVEYNRFNTAFALREQLQSFELGLEYLRLFCFEEAPELGLPNKGLFAALGDIDLNLLIGRLDAVEEKLRRILTHLGEHGFSLEAPNAPEGFWWRHFKAPPKKEHTGRHRKG
jgi:hypothetical protein